MAAAAEAGVHAVGVATGSFSAADLVAAGAEVVLESLLEFPPWYAAAARRDRLTSARPWLAGPADRAR